MEDESRWLRPDKYWVSHYNYVDEVRQQFTLPERVYIHDVTLREAEQCPRVAIRPDEKIRIAQALNKLGVSSIEIAPFYSPEDKEATKELMSMRHKGELDFKVIALSRWVEPDIDLALECGVDGIMIECVGNPWFSEKVWGIDEPGIAERLAKMVAYAKTGGAKLIIAEPWDDYKAPLNALERVYKAAVFDGGADHVSISDTFGFTLPCAITYVIRKLKSWVPGIPVEHHAHNDFGLATTVMLAAVAGGAEVCHTSVNTLGERAGNAATQEVAVALELLMGVNTGIKLEQIYPTAQLVAELSKMPIALNAPIVGENEFLIGSSMVSWMMDKLGKTPRPWTMSPFAPELIGRKGFEVILGKGAGKFTVASKLKEMGISVADEQLREIVERVKAEASLRKWSVPDVALKEIVDDVAGE